MVYLVGLQTSEPPKSTYDNPKNLPFTQGSDPYLVTSLKAPAQDSHASLVP